MKKLLSVLIVVVMVVAMFGTAIAALNVSEDDTTKVWTGNPDIAMSFDTFYLDGVSHMDLGWGADGGAAAKLSANPVTVGDHQTLTLRGWAGIKGDPKITLFGYRINGGEAVYDESFAKPTEDPVIAAGGDSRMEIVVPIAGLTAPTLITAVAKGDDGNEYDFIEFSVNGQYTEPKLEVVNKSWDWLAASGAFLTQAGHCDQFLADNPLTVYKYVGLAAANVIGALGWAQLTDGAALGGFAYAIDDGEIVTVPVEGTGANPGFYFDRVAELEGAGFAGANGFWIVFPFTDLEGGEHVASLYALDAKGEEHFMYDLPFAVKEVEWLCDDGARSTGWWMNPLDGTQRAVNVQFTSENGFDGVLTFAFTDTTATTPVTVNLFDAEGELLDSSDILCVGDTLYTNYFSKAYPAGTYTLQYATDSTSNGWFVLGSGGNNGADVAVTVEAAGTNENTLSNPYVALISAEAEPEVEGYYIWNHDGEVNLADPFNDTTRVGHDSPLTATIKFKTDVSFSKILFPQVWATPHTVATIRLLAGEEEVFAGTAPEFYNEANGSGDLPNVEVDFGEAIPAGQYTLEISVPEGFYAFFAYGADPLSEDYIEFERGHMIFGLYTEDEGEGFVELDGDEPIVDPGEVRLGDVNGDGKVNNKDVVALFRHVSDEEVAGFVEEAADINGDKKINNKDVVKLFKLVSSAPEEKNASLKAQSFNTVWADGALICDVGDALGFLAENPIQGDVKTIGVRGWAQIQDGEIAQFGYKLDGGEPVFDAAYTQDRADVWNAFGATAATANGYDIENVDVSALETGDHTITVLVKATDGTIIEVVTAPFSVERPVPVELLNVSYDGLYYDGVLKLKEGGVDKQIILEENRPALDMQKGSISTITVRGWARISEDTADIAGYGYSIDGGEVVYGEFIENRPDLAAAGFPGGVGFQILVAGINELDIGEHTVDAYLITADGEEVKIVKRRGEVDNQVGVTFTVTEDAPPVAPAITNTCVDASSTTDGVVFARGWTGATYPIAKIGYTVDDGEPIWNGEIVQLADDDPVKYPQNAGQYGIRISVTAPYADLTAEDHVIKFVAQLDDEDETVLPLGPATVWTVKGEAPLPPSVKVIVNGETTKADVVPASVALSMDGENLVVTTDSGAGDPWFAVAVPNVAADDYASFTIKFKLNKAIGTNNTYLCDGDKNFTGATGAWVPNGMAGMEDGEWHEVTYKLSDFTYFAGKTLTYIRFTAAQSEGVMTVESVKFNKAGDEPVVVPTLAAMSFDTFFLNGQTHMDLGWGADGDAATKLAANPVSGEVKSIGGRGWAWIKDGVIEAMGYKIDDGEPVFDASYTQDRPDVRNALGGLSADVANGFNVQADTSALYDGEHTVTLVVKATDGTVINIVSIPFTVTGNPKPASLHAMSFNTVYCDGALICDTGDALGYLAQNPLSGDLQAISARGWAWLDDGEIDQFGYQLDDGAITYDAAYTEARADVQAAFSVSASVANGFSVIPVDVSKLLDGEHTLTVYVKATDGTEIKVVSYPFTIAGRPIPASLKNKSFNTVWVNGTQICDVGDAKGYVAENPIKGKLDSIGVRGWAHVKDGEIGQYGYKINDGEPVFDAAFTQSRPDVQQAFGVTAAEAEGFSINPVDISALEDGEYTLTVLVKATDGTIIEVCACPFTVERVSPEVKTVNALYALGDNESLEGTYTLTGKIIKVDTAYNERYGNVTVTIAVPGVEDKPVMCYRLAGDGADKIAVGDVITVTGELTHFVNTNNNAYEFKQGCTLDSWKTDYFTETFDGEAFDSTKLAAWGGSKLEGGKLHLGWSGNWVESSPALYTKATYTNYVAEFKLAGDARDCYYGFALRTKGDGSMMNGGRFGVPSASEPSVGIAIDTFGAGNSTLGDMIGITFCNGGANGDAPCIKVARPEGFDGKTEAAFKVVDTGEQIVITINDAKVCTIKFAGLTDGKYTQATVLGADDVELGTFDVSILAEGSIAFYQRNDHITIDDFSVKSNG